MDRCDYCLTIGCCRAGSPHHLKPCPPERCRFFLDAAQAEARRRDHGHNLSFLWVDMPEKEEEDPPRN